MVEPRCEPNFAPDIFEPVIGDDVVMGDFEGDGDAFNRIMRPVHSGKSAFGKAFFDSVLAEFLARLEHGEPLPFQSADFGILAVSTPGRKSESSSATDCGHN